MMSKIERSFQSIDHKQTRFDEIYPNRHSRHNLGAGGLWKVMEFACMKKNTIATITTNLSLLQVSL